MVYIFNKYISPKKNIKTALTSIFGIGPYRANDIIKFLSINPNIRFGQVKPIEVSKITKYISYNYKVGTFLQKDIIEQIKKYIKIRHYKGIRHKNKLPVRGQRTHTNAQTRKKMTVSY